MGELTLSTVLGSAVLVMLSSCAFDPPRCSDPDPPAWCVLGDAAATPATTRDASGLPDSAPASVPIDAMPIDGPDAPECPLGSDSGHVYQKCIEEAHPTMPGCKRCATYGVDTPTLPGTANLRLGPCCRFYGCTVALDGVWPACD